jgi:membrane-bound metal-dependent hydrolase YbcI (DUF457 family)
MARRRTHLVVGVAAGAAGAAYRSRRGTTRVRVAETLGGGIGGAVGGLLPDYLEPAVNSWHRSVCHSYATVCVGAAKVPNVLSQWEAYCRRQAEIHDQLAASCKNDCQHAWHVLCALLWRMASRFVVGVAAGYLSHLALDQLTPRGLPLLF